MPAKKKTIKKATKKSTGKVEKSAPKRSSTKAAKKTVAKKVTSRKESKARKSPAKKAARKTTSAKSSSPSPSDENIRQGIAAEEVDRKVREALKQRRGEKKEVEDPQKSHPLVFSMDDVREFLKSRKKTASAVRVEPKKVSPTAPETSAAKGAEAPAQIPSRPKQSFGAASVADLLGFDPTVAGAEDSVNKSSEKDIPKKFLPYFRALVQLHEEVYEGLHRHSEETLRRSNKEDSGDLSSYGQHMADAGTDSFDRDFALSMVSSEQEALYEIDEAVRRIRNGTYGVCEITGKPISRDRLRAVPFTRYSVEGQMEVERGRKRVVQKAGIQGFDGDDSPLLSDEDSDE